MDIFIFDLSDPDWQRKLQDWWLEHPDTISPEVLDKVRELRGIPTENSQKRDKVLLSPIF